MTYSIVPTEQDIKDVMEVLEGFGVILSVSKEPRAILRNKMKNKLTRAYAESKLRECKTLVELDRMRVKLIIGEN